MRKLIFSRVLFILIFYGCGYSKDSSQEKRIVKKSYYENGQLKTEQEFIHDTVQDGYYKRYYQNGQIEIEIPYLKNKKEGVVYTYYKNGDKESEVPFSRGKEDGVGKWYYNNGKIKELSNFSQGSRIGETISYYDSGKIKIYMFFNNKGEVGYIRRYDEEGVFKEEEGHAITNVHLESDSIKKGDTLIVKLDLAVPPETIPSLYVGDLNGDNDVVNRIKLSFDKNKNIFIYKKVYIKEGIYKWGIAYQLKDVKTNKVSEYLFVMSNLIVH